MIKWFLFQEYSFETEKNLQDDLDRLEAESIISPDNTINQEKTLEVTEMTRKKLSIKIQVWFCFCNTAIIMFGVFLLGNIIVWANYPLTNEVAKGYSNATVHPSHTCEHSRINILQWILTKLGTYLVLKRIWNLIDFQGHRGSNFYARGYATLCVALVFVLSYYMSLRSEFYVVMSVTIST